MANENDMKTSNAAGPSGTMSPVKCPVTVAEMFHGWRPPHRPSAITLKGDVAEIELRNGEVALIDAADAPMVLGACWRVHVSGTGGRYVSTKLIGEDRRQHTIYLHRLLMPEAPTVDHIDSDGLNNRRANLRSCSQAENVRNRGPMKGRKLKGVFPTSGGKSWYARLRVAGAAFRSPSFPTQEEAAAAYDRLAAEYHGAFARTNMRGTIAPSLQDSEV